MPYTGNEPVIDPQIPLEIGRVIMGWARVEEAFDTDIEFLCKNPNASRILPPEIPNAFAPRLRLWHRLVRAAYPDVPLYLTVAQEIRTAADLLATWRNNLNHGWVTIEKGRVKIVNIKRVGRIRTVEVYKDIDPAELPIVSKDIKRLEDEVLSFSLNHFWLKTHRLKPPQS